MAPSRNAFLLSAAIVLLLVVLIALFPGVSADPVRNDFTAYWAAGRVAVNGGNPYSPTEIFAVEQTIGWPLSTPLMIWNPPWMLTVLIPAGLAGFEASRNVWLVLQLALTLGCSIALWRFYGGSRRGEVVAVVIAILYAPLTLSMKYGQVGPLCLAGVTGFLVLQRTRWDFLAGAMLALAALKPHIVYLVWPAVLVWAVVARRWKVLIGLAAAGLFLAVVPLVATPRVYGEFIRMFTNPPPQEEGRLFLTQQESPTWGWQLRLLFGKEYFKLQYVPSLLGLAWLAWYGRRHRNGWDWAERLPVLLMVSLVTAAYGAWMADALLILPALFAIAPRLVEGNDPRYRMAGLVSFTLLMAALHLIESHSSSVPYVWVAPIYLLLYFWFDAKLPGLPRGSSCGPEGATEGSQGWSAAEPLVRR